MCSCSSAHIKEPQPFYILNFKLGVAARGTKNFDYKKGSEYMTGWVEKPKLVKWSELPKDMVGIPLEVWLTRLAPALKKLATKHRDQND